MEPMPEQPIKWLLREMHRYLTDRQYDEVLAGFSRVKQRYDVTTKLRTEQTKLNNYYRSQKRYPEDSERWRHWKIMIESKQARVDHLKRELEEIR